MASYIPPRFTNEDPHPTTGTQTLTQNCSACLKPHAWRLRPVWYQDSTSQNQHFGTMVSFGIATASQGVANPPVPIWTIVPHEDLKLPAVRLAFNTFMRGGSGQQCSSVELMADLQAGIHSAGLSDTFPTNTSICNTPCIPFDDDQGNSWEFYPDNLPLNSKNPPGKRCGRCGGGVFHLQTLLSGHFKSADVDGSATRAQLERGTPFFTSTGSGGAINHTIQALLPDRTDGRAPSEEESRDPLGLGPHMKEARLEYGPDAFVWCDPAIFRRALEIQAAAGEGRAHIARAG